MYVRDSLLYSTRGLSRDSRSYRTAQIVARRLQALSSAFENLNMDFRDREVPGPCPIPPVRTPLEIEASLLDSDVQGLLGTEELADDETTSGPQLQWAAHSEFPSVVRLFELKCCTIPRTAAGSAGFFACSTCKSVVGLHLETQGGEVVVHLADGPSGVAHPQDSCAVVFIETRGPAGYNLRSSRGVYPTGFHIHRRWSELLLGTRDTADSMKAVCCVHQAPPKKSTQV